MSNNQTLNDGKNTQLIIECRKAKKENMKYTEVIANRLQKLLDEKGLRQNDLAKRSGVSKSTISKLLTLKNVKPYASTLHNICKGLGISLSEFYDDPQFDTSI